METCQVSVEPPQSRKTVSTVSASGQGRCQTSTPHAGQESGCLKHSAESTDHTKHNRLLIRATEERERKYSLKIGTVGLG